MPTECANQKKQSIVLLIHSLLGALLRKPRLPMGNYTLVALYRYAC